MARKMTFTNRGLETLKTAKGQEDFADTKLPGLKLRVSKTGAKTFWVRPSIDGSRRFIEVGVFPIVGLGEARQRAAEILANARVGVDLAAIEEAEESGETLGQFWPLFLADRAHLSAVSIRGYNGTWRKHVEPAFGNRPMSSVTRKEVLRFLATRSSDAVHNQVRTLIHNLWNSAIGVGFGDVENNPAAATKPRAKPKRKGTFNIPQLRLLWAGFGSTEVAGRCYKIMLLTAQRMGQCRMMRWEDIEVESNTWKCPGEFCKHGNDTWIPLSTEALEVLEEMRDLGLSDEWVFPALHDYSADPFIHALSDNFRSLLRSLRIKGIAHDLRRTFRSYATASKDGDAATRRGLGVMGIVADGCISHTPQGLGHSTYSDDEARCADLITERRAAMQAWADFLIDNDVIPARAAAVELVA